MYGEMTSANRDRETATCILPRELLSRCTVGDLVVNKMKMEVTDSKYSYTHLFSPEDLELFFKSNVILGVT